MQYSKLLSGITALLLLSAMAGCSNVEPWVKPYERDRLADPIMLLDGDPEAFERLGWQGRAALPLAAAPLSGGRKMRPRPQPAGFHRDLK